VPEAVGVMRAPEVGPTVDMEGVDCCVITAAGFSPIELLFEWCRWCVVGTACVCACETVVGVSVVVGVMIIVVVGAAAFC